MILQNKKNNKFLNCETLGKFKDNLSKNESKRLKLLISTQMRNLAIKWGIHKAILLSNNYSDLTNLNLRIYQPD